VKWVVELGLSALILGFVFYVLSAALPSPAYIASEREVTANAYFTLLRLASDPAFMTSVEEAVCKNNSTNLRDVLDAAIPVYYIYNFTVYLDDVRPPTCRVCADWSTKLVSVARPNGTNTGGVGAAVVPALLSDGTRVRMELSLARP
jgi:hypothetical protein